MFRNGVERKFLEIGNYPPPLCGWAMQTKLLREELHRRGYTCDVLKINENRHVKSPEYVDVQNGSDYFLKVLRFAARGYRFHVHLNAESAKGYLLALCALLLGRMFFVRTAMSFHGGLPQTNFPQPAKAYWRWAFRVLFRLPHTIFCNSTDIKEAIVGYGAAAERVYAIPAFSAEHLQFSPVTLAPEIESFLGQHSPVFFCYVSFRPEYRLPVLRDAMLRLRQQLPPAGFIWLGFPQKEMPAARDYIQTWTEDERRSLLLLGNLPHDAFLTLLSRSTASVRTPMCDGVCASVLESIALRVPVVASDNHRRPTSVVTYKDEDAEDLCAKLLYVSGHRDDVVADIPPPEIMDRNISSTADILCGEARPEALHAVRA